MSIIVNGNQIAKQILNRLSLRIKQQKLKPHLAIVMVGTNPASLTYVRKKLAAAVEIGMKCSLFKFPSKISTANLIAEIRRIQRQKLSGIIIQLPLPKTIDKRKVLNQLSPELDVDYLSWEALGKLVIGENPLVPPTPGAILEVLKYYKIPLVGKHIVLVGQGDLIGKPLANLLLQLPVTMTVCSKGTKNLSKYTKQADILITGVGQANLIRGSMVKRGAVVIDAGVSFKGKKISGDVNFTEVSKVASIITPTPGGIGPITVAKLLENTARNVKMQK